MHVRNQDHSFYLLAQQGKTLEDFVWYRISKQGLTNPMTRLISGINPYPVFNPLPMEFLQIASANVESYRAMNSRYQMVYDLLRMQKRKIECNLL